MFYKGTALLISAMRFSKSIQAHFYVAIFPYLNVSKLHEKHLLFVVYLEMEDGNISTNCSLSTANFDNFHTTTQTKRQILYRFFISFEVHQSIDFSSLSPAFVYKPNTDVRKELVTAFTRSMKGLTNFTLVQHPLF